MNETMKSRRIALLGISVALAMILSYLESLVPLSFAVPGIKMGLANLVILFLLYRQGLLDACIVSLIRVVLSSLLFGNAMSLIYSLAGAVLSLAVMTLLKKWDRFSCVGVSVAGGIFHNIGQILAAVLLLETTQIAYYLPVLLISGIVTGTVIGLVAAILIRRIPWNAAN